MSWSQVVAVALALCVLVAVCAAAVLTQSPAAGVSP